MMGVLENLEERHAAKLEEAEMRMRLAHHQSLQDMFSHYESESQLNTQRVERMRDELTEEQVRNREQQEKLPRR